MVGWCINSDQCQKRMATQIYSPDGQEVKNELGPGAQYSLGRHTSNDPKTSHYALPLKGTTTPKVPTESNL